MNNHRSFRQLITSWGHKERQFPPHNGEQKNTVLAYLESIREEAPAEAHGLPWLSFAFTGLAVIVLLVHAAGFERTTPFVGVAYPQESGSGVMPGDATSRSSEEKGVAPDYYPRPPKPSVPITDTREFLKTDYQAAIRTRRVEELTRRIETTVRGFGGRIDSSASSQRYGFIQFAVPASTFDSFRKEIEGLVGERFLTADVRTENLLGEKQSIEGEKKRLDQALTRLVADRKKLVADHAGIVSSLQARLTVIAGELAMLRAEQTNDPVRKSEIARREAELMNEQGALATLLASEDASYTKQLSSFDRRIREAEASLESVKVQDQNLLDTVATVRGTISVNWIRIGDVIQLYVSPYWIAFILAVAAVISYFLHRRWWRMAMV